MDVQNQNSEMNSKKMPINLCHVDKPIQALQCPLVKSNFNLFAMMKSIVDGAEF